MRILSVVFVCLCGCSMYTKQEWAEYKEWTMSADGKMVSISEWNQKYRKGWRQRAKIEDEKVKARIDSEYEEWKNETNGGLVYEEGTGRKVECGREKWEKEFRAKWLDECDKRERIRREQMVIDRMEQAEDAKKSPEERHRERFEKLSSKAMSVLSEGHANCSFCGFRFGMSKAEAYKLIELDGGQTGGGGRIWQYGLLRKSFRLFDRVQLCFLHGRLYSLKLLSSKDYQDQTAARREMSMVERLIEKKFGTRFHQGDQQMLSGREVAAMGAVLGNMGVEMAMTANEQEKKVRRLTAGDIVICHRGTLNVEVTDIRLENELENAMKKVKQLEKRSKDNMNGLILDADDGADVL